MRTTVTFSESLWGEIKRRANAEGVSASEYIRAAVLMRIAWEAGKRRDRALRR